MADYAELLYAARAAAGHAADSRLAELILALCDALEATLPRHAQAMELADLRAEVEQLRAELARREDTPLGPGADQAPTDAAVTLAFSELMNVFLDGMGTGIASTLHRWRPDAPEAVVIGTTQETVRQVLADPIAIEGLRDHVRRRLRGDVDDAIATIKVHRGDRG